MPTETKTESKKGRYYEAVGKRKTSIARVRLSEGGKTVFLINGKDLAGYFPTEELQHVVGDSLRVVASPMKFHVSAHITGGGIHSQAEALRGGIARALLKLDLLYRVPLKKAGFLSRDARIKERRKFGKKKARKSPQWSKR